MSSKEFPVHFLEKLQTFTKFVEAVVNGKANSMNAAARQMDINPSSLSACIGEIEDYYGKGEIVSRDKGGAPTEGGWEIYSAAKKILKIVADLKYDREASLTVGVTGDMRPVFNIMTAAFHMANFRANPEYKANRLKIKSDTVAADFALDLNSDKAGEANLYFGSVADTPENPNRVKLFDAPLSVYTSVADNALNPAPEKIELAEVLQEVVDYREKVLKVSDSTGLSGLKLGRGTLPNKFVLPSAFDGLLGDRDLYVIATALVEPMWLVGKSDLVIDGVRVTDAVGVTKKVLVIEDGLNEQTQAFLANQQAAQNNFAAFAIEFCNHPLFREALVDGTFLDKDFSGELIAFVESLDARAEKPWVVKITKSEIPQEVTIDVDGELLKLSVTPPAAEAVVESSTQSTEPPPTGETYLDIPDELPSRTDALAHIQPRSRKEWVAMIDKSPARDEFEVAIAWGDYDKLTPYLFYEQAKEFMTPDNETLTDREKQVLGVILNAIESFEPVPTLDNIALVICGNDPDQTITKARVGQIVESLARKISFRAEITNPRQFGKGQDNER